MKVTNALLWAVVAGGATIGPVSDLQAADKAGGATHRGSVTAFSGPYLGFQFSNGATEYTASNFGAGSDNNYNQGAGGAPTPRLGGLFGYGLRFGNFYVGPEFKAVWDNHSGRNRLSSSYGEKFEKKWTLGAGVRGGYVVDNAALLYGRGGYVRSRFRDRLWFASGSAYPTRNDQLNGYEIGVGIETRIGYGLSARAEYTYSAYDRAGMFTSTTTAQGKAPYDQLATIGLAYYFGANASTEENRPPADFGGFYMGVQAGYGDIASAIGMPSDRDSNYPASGVQGGVFAGYGSMFGCFYLGGEAEIGYGNEEFEEFSWWNTDNDPYVSNYSKRLEGGLSARVGYRVNNISLVYGRVGGVAAEYKVDYDSNTQGYHKAKVLPGIRYGGGIEVALSNAVSLRADYTYTAFSSWALPGGNDPGGLVKLVPKENLYRAGLVYHF